MNQQSREDTACEIQTKIAVLHSRIEGQEKALLVAMDASNKRLDILNEWRQTYADLASGGMSRVEVMAALSARDERTETEINTLREKFEVQTRPNYVVAVSLISTLLIGVGGMWTVTGLKIDNSISPVVVSVEAVKSIQMSREQRFIELESRMRSVITDQQSDKALADESVIAARQMNDRMKTMEEIAPRVHVDLRGQINDLRTSITRLETWMNFVHAKVFPTAPVPAQNKQ